tara:strand:+ start:640 stop:1362 length:723 start_codon:yes stop_codon:yes gene_type:complete
MSYIVNKMNEEMEIVGTKYGGWILPKKLELDENSVIYSAGVGEDISFDMIMSDRYKCNIVLIDPSDRPKTHFDEVKHYYEKIKWKMTGDIQEDYYGIMYPLKPTFDNISFVKKGLWNEKTEKVKFYKQENKKYVSQSLIKGVFTDEYNHIDTDTIRNIMNEFGHFDIDILKLSIVGAELKVLEDMFNESIFPKYICVHFTFVKGEHNNENDIVKVIGRLASLNYKIIAKGGSKLTFKLCI